MRAKITGVTVLKRQKKTSEETARIIEDLDRTIKEMQEMMGVIKRILGDVGGDYGNVASLGNRKIYSHWEDMMQGS